MSTIHYTHGEAMLAETGLQPSPTPGGPGSAPIAANLITASAGNTDTMITTRRWKT